MTASSVTKSSAIVRCRRRGAPLLEGDFREAAQLAAVQPGHAAGTQDVDGAHADAQMLVHALAVEVVGHARQLDLAVQRLVGHAQQRAVGHAEAEAVGGDGGAFHVQRHGAALAEAPLGHVVGQQFPIAVVGAGHGAGAHDALELVFGHLGHVGHRLLERELDLGQRGDRHPQGQFLVEHVVLAHVGVRQNVVAQLLAVAQARAVAQHHPGVRPQHGDVVGDGLGVRRAHADVHHAGAAAVGAHEVVGGHLRQARRRGAEIVARLGGQAGAAGDHVAGFDEGDVFAVGVRHLGMAQAHEFIDVELVVREQHEVLEPLGRGARIVAQAVQRIVHARRGEQRQRLRLARARLPGAVGDAVVHGSEVGQVEHVAHEHAALGREGALDVVVLGEREVDGDGLVADAHLQFDVVAGAQQPELLGVVAREQVRAGEGGLVAARPLHEAVGQLGGRARHRGGLHPHEGVERPHVAVRRLAGHEALHGVSQVADLLLVDALDLGQRVGGIGVEGGLCEFWDLGHGRIVHARRMVRRERGRAGIIGPCNPPPLPRLPGPPRRPRASTPSGFPPRCWPTCASSATSA